MGLTTKEREQYNKGLYKERTVACKIAKRLARHRWDDAKPSEFMGRAWAIVKFESNLTWSEYCMLKFNSTDLDENHPSVKSAVDDGMEADGFMENEVDTWGDFDRAFKRNDYKRLASQLCDFDCYIN